LCPATPGEDQPKIGLTNVRVFLRIAATSQKKL
jgi:hypothetical protein